MSLDKLKKRIDKTADAQDLIYLIIEIPDLEDQEGKELAKNIINKALKNANSNDLPSIASTVGLELDDKEWAFEIYKTAIDNSEDAETLLSIADDLYNDHENEEYAKIAFNKALHYADEIDVLVDIAQSAMKLFEDIDLAKKLVEIALNKAKTVTDFRKIARFTALFIDSEFGVKIMSKALSLSKDYNDSMIIATESVEFINNVDLAKSAIESAVEFAKSESDPLTQEKMFRNIAKDIVTFFNDKAWAKKVKEMV